MLSKRLGRPVKVVWTRRGRSDHDFYHAAAAVYHKAVVDGRGKPTAWLQRSAFQPIASTFDPTAKYPLGFELDLGLTDLPYDVAHIRAENGPADANVRIGWFRAVTNNFHVFASGSFADEMAHAAGRDPLEFLLDLLGPGKVLDLKAQGVEYSNYGAPYDKYPIDTRGCAGWLKSPVRNRVGDSARRGRPRHGHRRAPQASTIRGVGRGSRSGQPRNFTVPRIEQGGAA